MKAVVFRDASDIRVQDVPEPRLREPTDAIVRLTASALCGTDLHFVRGTFAGVERGTVLGHEGVAVVEAPGEKVRNPKIGDRVVNRIYRSKKVPREVSGSEPVFQIRCGASRPRGAVLNDIPQRGRIEVRAAR